MSLQRHLNIVVVIGDSLASFSRSCSCVSLDDCAVPHPLRFSGFWVGTGSCVDFGLVRGLSFLPSTREGPDEPYESDGDQASEDADRDCPGWGTHCVVMVVGRVEFMGICGVWGNESEVELYSMRRCV